MESQGRLGPYRIDDELAQSSTCTVLRGFDEALSRPVLIKKLHAQIAREEDISSRFAREAQVCAQVKHENIVSVYGFLSEPGLKMLVTEFVEGHSLGELISSRGRIEWKAALAMLFYVLKGLDYAHTRGVVHRDIKPDNILVSLEGVVKISDFGLAMSEKAPRLTQQGDVVGTPAYMAPEQLSGEEADQRSDLFSLGVTFFEVLTGASLFLGENISETMKRVLTAQPQRPSALAPDVPAEFDQIILRLLEKRPTRRYATAAQTLEDVRHLARQHDVPLEQDAIRSFLGTPADRRPIDRQTKPSTARLRPEVKATWLVWAGIGALATALIVALLMLPLLKSTPFRGGTEVGRPGIGELGTLAVSAERGATLTPESLMVENIPPVKGTETRVAGEEHAPATGKPEAAREIPGPGKPAPAAEREAAAQPPVAEVTQEAPIPSTLPGRLHLTVRPWASVTIDRVSYGQTPLTEPVELAPGEHQIALTNDQFPASVVETVNIKPGEELKLVFELWNYFGTVRVLSVKPWAEIFLDRVSYGQTPKARPIIVSFGEHTIELKNPACQSWSRKVTLTPDSPTAEISVILEPLEGTEKR